MAELSSLESEQALLGAILVNNRAWERVADFLAPEHFADAVHGLIYAEISRQLREGRVVTGVTLKPFCEAHPQLRDIGGAAYVGQLAMTGVPVMAVRDYGRTIFDLARRRELIEYHTAGLAAARDVSSGQSAEELLTATLGGLERMYRGGAATDLPTVRATRLAAIEAMRQPSFVYSTGFPRLDKAMGGGLYPGKCYGLTAKFKVGKTAFAGTISHHLNETGVRHVYVTYEMGGQQIEMRAWAQEMGINALAFLNETWRADPHNMARAAEFALYAKENCWYADAAGVGLEGLQNLLTLAVLRHGCVGFMLDYLQIVGGRPARSSEREWLDLVAQWLAEVCARRKLWGFVLMQENDDGSTYGSKGPLRACDQVYRLQRHEGEAEAWLSMLASRYTRIGDVGSESLPGYRLETRTGPYYRELPGAEPIPEQEEIAL